MSEKLLATMRRRLQTAMDALSESRQSELDDLRFFAGSPDNQWQWPQEVLLMRTATAGQTINARPTLTINKLPQHVRQITNDQRQNRPAAKVIPVDDKADVEVAEVLNGMIRHIEYISDADVAYDTACENQVSYGEGYIRILSDYCDDKTFDQDLKIGRIRNSFSVHMDPTIQDPCGADAEWCFICEEITKEEYERLYPDAMPISTLQDQGTGDQSISAWLTEETVRIAEYFYVKHEKKTLNLYENGVALLSDDPQVKEAEAAAKQAGIELKPVKTRPVDVRSVKWLKTNGAEILEENDWPGKWIPVVRVVGNEFEVNGRLYLSGIVRNAKDAQRMYNYWCSQEAEMLALAPKAPFIGYGGQFEGYEGHWKNANINNYPYLEVNSEVQDGQGNPLPLPQRAQPPMVSSGLLQAKLGAGDDIKSTTGQYDASLGAEANEKSGRAILARERQTDTGTFHYVDNMARAVRYVGRQLIDLIPKYYDTRRIARIIGMDGETDHVTIDPEMQQPYAERKDQNGAIIEKIYNPGIGTYDVCATTGPSYMTKRQEAVEDMAQLLQGNPELWGIVGDLFVKNMDWPGAQEISDRIKRTIDPKLLQDGEDPQVVALQQQLEAQGQIMGQMQDMLQNVAHSFEAQEAARENYAKDIDAFKANTERMKALMDQATPEQIQMIVIQTLQQIAQAPSLEEEEPLILEQGEMHTLQEQQPPMGDQITP